MKTLVECFKHALLEMDHISAQMILEEAAKTLKPIECAEAIVVPVMEEIGEEWEQGHIALSQIYMSGRICEDAVNSILPQIRSEISQHPTIAIAVLHDQHTLGKNIVSSILHSAGFELKDYGAGLTAEQIISLVQEDEIKVLLISTLMVNSALMIKDIRRNFNELGLNIKIIVGGAPFRFDQNLWREVEADAMGTHASDVVELVKRIIEEIE